MIREYKTISEVVGPLMLVKDVDDVTYDELGEILLPSGEKRLCKVLEVNGHNALVQLFEASQGINLKQSTVRFLGHGTQRICSVVYSTVWEDQRTAGRTLLRKKCSTSTAFR